MTDSQSNKKNAKGFAGLASKVSDVSEDARRAVDAPEAPSSASRTAATPPPQPARAEPKPAAAESSPAAKSGKPGLGWIVACIVVFGIWMVNSDSGDHGKPSATYGADTPSVLPLAPAGSAMDGVSAAALDEQRPPVGRDNVLGIPQIRWCKREKIRIEAIEIVVDNGRSAEVGVFNAKADDYNSRCAAYRYRRGQAEQVERELAPERESLATTTRIEWAQMWLGSSSGTAATRADEPEPFSFDRSNGARPEPATSQMALSEEEQVSIDSACSDQKNLYGQAAYDKCASKKKSALASAPRNINLTALNASERESIESACSDQKILQGPAEYNVCLSRKLSALQAAPRNIDLSDLNTSERESIESACSDPKVLDGPAAYYRCLSKKLAAFRAGPRNVDLSNLSDAERGSIESACSGPKILNGPAAYNTCLTQKLRRLRHE